MSNQHSFYSRIGDILDNIRTQGLWKQERVLGSPQGNHVAIVTEDGSRKDLVNFCSNNYLGLANNPAIIKRASQTMEKWGYGLASVRFICGTQSLHTELEHALANFLGKEACILFSSCFDANGALFEAITDDQSVIIADSLNHASLIDGVRLSKARRIIYTHGLLKKESASAQNRKSLEECLIEAKDASSKIIVTDGVFSMDGDLANLKEIQALAKAYDAIVVVDDSHATGVYGAGGRGSADHFKIDIDVVTTTFGKALGGASGGCIAASKKIVDLVRQKGRPYLFSNSLPPAIVGGTLEALHILSESSDLVNRLWKNTQHFRKLMGEAGFDIKGSGGPICPIMLYDEAVATRMARLLFDEGVYVVGFSFPVVPKGLARIRTQISACHEDKDIEFAAKAFTKVGAELGII